MEFFLLGIDTTTRATIKNTIDKNPIKWLKDDLWYDLHSSIPLLSTIALELQSVANDDQQLQLWQMFTQSDDYLPQIPSYYITKHQLDHFQQLLILQIFHADKLISIIKDYIIKIYISKFLLNHYH